nr:putative ribonuclease H-like domain-containing protein [Tanacetum cinerariifolium]
MQQKIERLQAQLGDLKGKSNNTSCVSDTRNPLSQKLKNENVELEFQVLNYAKENAHLKATYKNLFDSISVSRTQTKTIISSMQHELQHTIYKNSKLRAQLFKKVSVRKDNTRGTSMNTKFAKQSILGKPPMLGEIHALSKPVTSNSTPTPQESKVVKNDKPMSNTKNDRVPSASKSSQSKNKEVEVEEHHRNLLLSKNTKHMSSACNNIKLDSYNVISKVVCAMCKKCLISVNHDVCLRNYMNGKTSRGKKQKENVSIKEKQNKHQPKVKKTKKVGFIDRLATPKPSKPRFLLRWSPTGRLFDLKGKIIASSESESQSDCSKGDNTCTTNILEPKIKRFPNSTSLLGRSKDEAPKVIKTFLKRIIVLLQSLVIIIRTDNGTEFKNQVLKEYFDTVGISHQVSSVQTPQQNGVVERRNRTLVEAARTMLIFFSCTIILMG